MSKKAFVLLLTIALFIFLTATASARAEPVAKIGATSYASWNEAYTDAQDGDTITLLSDITVSGKITINKKITLDGDGHIINAPFTSKTFILEIQSDCTLKNVTLNTTNKAKGVKIASGNVVFDTVSIPNSNQSDALTVYGTLTIKNYFKALSTYATLDARNGTVIVEEGTVFDMNKWSGNVSMTSDLKLAENTSGGPFFCAYAQNIYYYTLRNVLSIKNGLTLLKDASMNYKQTISSPITIHLNGHTLSFENGKTLTVKDKLTAANGGDIEGDIVFSDLKSAIEINADCLTVRSTVDNYFPVYEDGMYFLETYYPISFVDEDDSVLQSSSVAYGQIPEYTGEAPSKEADELYSYTFAGWTPEIVRVSGEAVYKAVYTPFKLKYTVSFAANGGSGSMAPQTLTWGAQDQSLSPNAFTRDGYTFAGWNTAADGSGETYCDCAVIGAAFEGTLYAQWSKTPQTGDGSHFILWTAVCCMGIFGFLAFARSTKQRKAN